MTLPKCMLCSNFNENSEEMTCKAFPDGIPEDVIFSGYEEECKNGIKFKPDKLAATSRNDRWYFCTYF